MAAVKRAVRGVLARLHFHPVNGYSSLSLSASRPSWKRLKLEKDDSCINDYIEASEYSRANPELVSLGRSLDAIKERPLLERNFTRHLGEAAG